MNKCQEQIQARISRKGMIAEDIRHPGRLSDDQIADIPIDKVYTWVRSGEWKPKHFNIWLKTIRVIE